MRTAKSKPGQHGAAHHRCATRHSMLISLVCGLGWPLANAEGTPEPPAIYPTVETQNPIEFPIEPASSEAVPLQPATPDTISSGSLPAAGDGLSAENEDEYTELERQIDAFEHEQAEIVLRARIATIERGQHRYAAELIRPLTLLGDAQMKSGEFTEALDSYGRAVHIDRVANGLHSQAQIGVVYKEAEAYIATGNLMEANNRYEYAYEVQSRRYGPYGEEMLEPTIRLGDWYMSHHNVLPARQLYERALAILQANGRADHPDAIPTLRSIALTYRLERFPPIYIRPRDEKSGLVSEELRGLRPPEELQGSVAAVNQFPRGEKALNNVVHIIRADPNAPPQDISQALLDLGDWYLLFGYTRRAVPLYAEAYRVVAEGGNPDDLSRFDVPQLLHFPMPADPKRPSASTADSRQSGHVKLGFTVTKWGEVRALTTLASEPPDLMDFRVRRSMREARFRPRLLNGENVESQNQEYTHDFHYYPREQAPQETQAEEATTALNTSQEPKT